MNKILNEIEGKNQNKNRSKNKIPSMEKNKISAECFVPGHITGFFEICDSENPLKKGSKGAGIVLDKGVFVNVSLIEKGLNEKDKNTCVNPEVYFNGKVIKNQIMPTLIQVILESFPNSLREEINGFLENYSVVIDQKSDFEPSSGFGVSAAGSLGVSKAFFEILKNTVFKEDEFEKRAEYKKWADLAHLSEIKTGSGLGDVSAIIAGGLAFRKKPGAPSVGNVKRVKIPQKKIYYVTCDKMDTSSVLGNPEKAKGIKKAGKKSIESFKKEKTFENFMNLSNCFTREIGLETPDIKRVLEKIDPEIALASQAMLGNTVFAVTNDFDNDLTGRNRNNEINEKAEKHIYEVLLELGEVKTCNVLNKKTHIKVKMKYN